jgi:hypothetical protein
MGRSVRTLIPINGGPSDGGAGRVSRAEHLVGIGFRCSLVCLRTGDVGLAGRACQRLRDALDAGRLTTDLVAPFTAWALAVEANAARPVTILPVDAGGFCTDECLAISLVAACQNNACPALTACALALLGTPDDGRVIAATREVADALREANALLDLAAVVETDGFAKPTAPSTDRLQ